MYSGHIWVIPIKLRSMKKHWILFFVIFNSLQSFALFISHNSNVESSVEPLRYDLKIVLRTIEAVKVDEGFKPGDNEEDLFGAIYVDRYKFGSLTGDFQRDEKVFWSAKPRSLEHIGKNSPKKIEKEILIANNLSFDDLINGELVIDGQLADDDPLIPQYECDCERNPSNSADIERRIRFNYEKTKASILRLQRGSGFKAIDFGKDKYFEMNFFEVNKDRQGSHIRFWFQILVNAH